MKKLRAKMRRLKVTRWNKLTIGEKIMKIVITLLKLAAIVALVVTAVSVVFSAAVVFIFIGGIIAGLGYSGPSEHIVWIRR